MRIRFALRARRDLEDIREYLEMRRPAGARNVLRAIRSAVRIWESNRSAGSKRMIPPSGSRLSWLSLQDFYRIRGDIIEIVHVRHTSRRPWIGP
ncbi:MAG: type II toxin-antitoxin system RelE/ParE family toxin [Xanthobacteraceae bacterium]